MADLLRLRGEEARIAILCRLHNRGSAKTARPGDSPVSRRLALFFSLYTHLSGDSRPHLFDHYAKNNNVMPAEAGIPFSVPLWAGFQNCKNSLVSKLLHLG
jgi:hypothetical protein